MHYQAKVKSDQPDLLHDSEKLILVDLSIGISVCTRDHMFDGGIIEIEVALAEHILELAGIEVTRVIAVEVPKHFPNLDFEIISIKLGKEELRFALT